MNNSLTIGKKALVMFVAIATIAWTLGIAAFAAPTASAATPGTLVKSASLSAVYYYGTDGQRYTFPNLKTYETWYTDFSSVTTISDSELAAIPLAGNVVYRSGSRWVKIQSDSKTYAVTPDGTLRWVETEAVAVGLAGSAWNTIIDDVPEVFFVDYTVGSSLMTAEAYDGMYLTDGTNDYVVLDGEKMMLTDAGKTANRVQDRFVLTPGDDLLGSLSAGADVTAADGNLNDPAQLGDSAPASVAGGLSVSLASDTPASATMPSSAANIAFLKVNLSANSGAATVTSLAVEMSGLGATSNISNLYLYEGAERLTNSRTVNSTTRVATFGGLNLDVADGQTRTLTLIGETSTMTGGDTIQFQISGVDSVATDASVSGSFPVVGNVMTASATTVGSITITDVGSLSNPTLGEVAKIANFRVAASATEGFMLERMTFDVRSAEKHSNYELRYNNDVLATGVQSGDYVTFTLATPYEVAQGNNRNLDLWAKIGGDSSDTVKTRIEETTDVVATGLKYGYGVLPDVTDFDTAPGSCTSDLDGCDYVTAQGGQLTVAFNGPTAMDIGSNATDVVLWEGTITAENYIEVRDFDFAIAGTDLGGASASNPNYQNFRVVRMDTGSTLMGPEEFDTAAIAADATSDTVSFSDDFSMEAGTSIDVQLLVDVKGSSLPYDVAAADSITATLTMSAVTARDSNNDELTAGTDIIPTASLAGNAQTVRVSSLTVTTASNPSSSTYVRGTNAVDATGFVFKAGTASDISISAITVKGVMDDDATTQTEAGDVTVQDKINSCSLYDSNTGSLISGPESPATGTAANLVFNGFDWTVPAGESYRALVRCNLANVAPDSSSSDSIYFEIDDDSDITAVDEDGNTVAAVDSTGTTISATEEINDDGEDVYQTIANAGTLTVAMDGDTSNSTIVLSNSTGVTTSKFKFTASNEAFVIDRLTIDNGGSSDVAVSTIELHYENEAGEEKIATGFLSSSTYIFNGLDIYVPKDDTAVVTAKVNTGDVTTSNSASGSTVSLDLSSNGTADSEFRAVSVGSGTTLVDSDVDVDGDSTADEAAEALTANTHEVRKTKPTVSLASGSPSGAAIVGLIEVLRFNITADSRGDVQIDDLTFEFSSTDNAVTGWNECNTGDIATGDVTLYDSNDLSTNLASVVTLLEDDGTTCAAAEDLNYINIDFASPRTIAAGTTKTYVLKLNVSNDTTPSAVQDDSMRVDIPTEDALDAVVTVGPYDAIGWVDSNTTVVDVDNDSGSIDAEYIKNLPINGGSLIF